MYIYNLTNIATTPEATAGVLKLLKNRKTPGQGQIEKLPLSAGYKMGSS